VIEWSIGPLLPLMVELKTPVFGALHVRAEELDGVMVVGFNMHISPDWKVMERLTVPVNP
jgi:hypothetical protein